jgi:hypothetical protein
MRPAVTCALWLPDVWHTEWQRRAFFCSAASVNPASAIARQYSRKG